LEQESVKITSIGIFLIKSCGHLKFDIGLDAVNFRIPYLDIGRSLQLQIFVLEVSCNSKQMCKISSKSESVPSSFAKNGCAQMDLLKIGPANSSVCSNVL
jgi:hypothetical protein